MTRHFFSRPQSRGPTWFHRHFQCIVILQLSCNNWNTIFVMAHNCNCNGQKDSKPDDVSNSISPSSGDVNSVNKNDGGSNAGCGGSNIADSNVPTAVTDPERENMMKVAMFVRKVLQNEEMPDDKMEWPLCLLFESKHSVTLSQEEVKNMILNKAAEVMALNSKSYIARQMLNLSECKRQQRLYYKKYKDLLKFVNNVNSELELLTRVPDNEVKSVRNVGTFVLMPTTSKEKK